ncbi:MAG: dTDP-4-dehydrorhamnose reductase [Muribaculaceae bacterium]|nr:dTDP-4-dehydrorhamnose reductase [Muribaculaceae bacterium]
MRILVTGANGQLGNCIRRAAEGSKDEYIFTDVEDLDITDREAVDLCIKCNNFDVVVNCAAYTNVEKAEEQQEFAEKLNAEAVRNLADACKKYGVTFIQISTDYVFGGSLGNTPRTEEEPVNPTGVYGVTKLHGEQAVAESGANALIFRTAWLYSEFGKNFVKTMLNLTSTKPELKVVFDQVGTPTYAQDLADLIVKIITDRTFRDHPGVYHYSNEGVCSWYDFTKMIAEIAGNKGCDIKPCHSDEFPSPVTRPSYSVLDKTKVKTTFDIEVPYWTDSLKKCVSQLMHNA